VNKGIIKYKYYARILSPRGIYPNKDVFFEDAVFVCDPDLTFSVVRYTKETRGGANEFDSYSEVQWINPTEARLLGSIMLSVDRDEGYVYFYPFPVSEMFESSSIQITKQWLTDTVKPKLIEKLLEGPQDLGGRVLASNLYQFHSDIPLPPIAGGASYTYTDKGLNYSLMQKIYNDFDINNLLLLRGLNTLMKSAMLRSHYQFMEESTYSLFVSLEVSYRLILKELIKQGHKNPTSEDAMAYIHDIFFTCHRNTSEKYFGEYYESRIMSLHPENRFGVYAHAPLMVDDNYFLFNDMLEVFRYLICGYVDPKHQKRFEINS
jgi:hypothetical protein